MAQSATTDGKNTAQCISCASCWSHASNVTVKVRLRARKRTLGLQRKRWCRQDFKREVAPRQKRRGPDAVLFGSCYHRIEAITCRNSKNFSRGIRGTLPKILTHWSAFLPRLPCTSWNNKTRANTQILIASKHAKLWRWSFEQVLLRARCSRHGSWYQHASQNV
jgi:hypothetical protein